MGDSLTFAFLGLFRLILALPGYGLFWGYFWDNPLLGYSCFIPCFTCLFLGILELFTKTIEGWGGWTGWYIIEIIENL